DRPGRRWPGAGPPSQRRSRGRAPGPDPFPHGPPARPQLLPDAARQARLGHGAAGRSGSSRLRGQRMFTTFGGWSLGFSRSGEPRPAEAETPASAMNRVQFSLSELLLAVVFLGLAAALMTAFEGHFFFHGLAMSVAVLFPAYLLAVIMLRH